MEPKKTFGEIIKGEKPVLVDFFATWCGPCQMMQPILKDLAGRIEDRATILKIDVDKNPQVAQTYQIQGVPTLILFQAGQVRWRQSGVLNASQLEAVIDRFAAVESKN